MPIIFRKTAKGLAEVESRAHRLPPRLRGMLILVDGKRDSDDLDRIVAQDAIQTLAALAEQGLIEAVGETLAVAESAASYGPVAVSTNASANALANALANASAPAPAPAPAPALAPGSATDLAALRRQVARALKEQLGASAGPLVKRIKAAHSADELKPLLSQAVKLVLAARGKTAADAFATRMPVL